MKAAVGQRISSFRPGMHKNMYTPARCTRSAAVQGKGEKTSPDDCRSSVNARLHERMLRVLVASLRLDALGSIFSTVTANPNGRGSDASFQVR